MNTLPLAPFLAALASDGIRLTLRDYERINLALHSAGDWTLPRLHDVLLALLAKDQAQQEILTRRFKEFFQLPPKGERHLSAVELDRVIAELKSLSPAPPGAPKTNPFRFDDHRKLFQEPSSRKIKPVWWIASTAILASVAVILWRMLLQTPPTRSPDLHLNTPEVHFGNILVDNVGLAEVPITNRGTAPLVIDSLALAGTQAGLFETIRDYSGVVIAPDSSMQIALVCSARVQGDFTDTLQIFSNKADSPHRVTLRATGFILQDTLQVTRPPSERKRLYTNVPYVKSITYSPLEKLDDWKWSALIAMLILVITVIYAVYLWRSRKIPEDKPPVWDENKPRHFSMAAIGGKPAPRLDDATLDQLADAMGYFQTEQPGKMLDVPASITATGRNGGMPTLAFYKRKQMRALLILEDAFAEALAWNSISAELAEGMRRRGVPVVYGKFHGSPEQFKTPEGMLHRLEDLEDERRGYLLLLFTDGKSLSRFDKLTASRQSRSFALERLGRWPMIAWMDLREPRSWEATVSLPARYGIPLYPATPEGLLQAVRRFLTEKGMSEDFSPSSRQASDLPAQFETQPQAYVEQWLGEALPWAQDCAMMVQPMSLGLADALRRRFHPHLPPEHIDRLLTLPGTMHNAAGLRFSAEVLNVLRRRFLSRRDEHEQEEVLGFLLAKIKEAKPVEAGTPAYLAWEAVHERVRLEQEPDDDLQRLGELAQTPLAASIRASLENFGFAEDFEKIPLRFKPFNNKALQRLSRINDNLGIAKLEAFPIAYKHWVLLLGMSAFFLTGLVGSIGLYIEPLQHQSNWQIVSIANYLARIERRQNGESWEVVATGKPRLENNQVYFDLFRDESQRDRALFSFEVERILSSLYEYRLTFYGNGYFSTKEFKVPSDTMVSMMLDSTSFERPCREEYPEIGLTVENCPDNGIQLVSQKTWKGTLGDQAPINRLMSVGLEIAGPGFPEASLLQQVHNILLETSSIDVLYRLQPDSAGIWHSKEALRQIERDLGPVMEQCQLLWWATDPSLVTVVNEDSLFDFQRKLKLNQGGSRLFWTLLLNDLLAPGDNMAVTEDEIVKILNPPNSPRGTGAPIVLIRSLKLDAALTTLTPPPGMVYIPDGRFLMGDNNGEYDEEPEHEVYVDAFFMDQTEVTVESYQRFLQATKHREPTEWANQLKNPQFPVIFVSWDDANAYAKWADKRLPTEAEWEYASRGGHTGIDGKQKFQYPWGNEPDSTKANGDWNNTRGYTADWKTAERNLRKVRSYPANGYGLYDMAGNVWEWCADWYDEKYYQSSPIQNPTGPEKGNVLVLRGGSWIYDPNYLRCASRGRLDSFNWGINVGFRCIQEAVR